MSEYDDKTDKLMSDIKALEKEREAINGSGFLNAASLERLVIINKEIAEKDKALCDIAWKMHREYLKT